MIRLINLRTFLHLRYVMHFRWSLILYYMRLWGLNLMVNKRWLIVLKIVFVRQSWVTSHLWSCYLTVCWILSHFEKIIRCAVWVWCLTFRSYLNSILGVSVPIWRYSLLLVNLWLLFSQWSLDSFFITFTFIGFVENETSKYNSIFST